LGAAVTDSRRLAAVETLLMGAIFYFAIRKLMRNFVVTAMAFPP
jgi:hypothetical protein